MSGQPCGCDPTNFPKPHWCREHTSEVQGFTITLTMVVEAPTPVLAEMLAQHRVKSALMPGIWTTKKGTS